MKRKLSLVLIAMLVLLQGLTVCAETTTTEGTTTSEVTATKASTWSVSVPDITLDTATGIGTGNVSVAADLGGTNVLSVTPAATVTMTQAGKADVTADVAMVKSSWTSSEITTTPTDVGVTITARTALTAGTYTGALVYTVDLAE